MEQETVNLLGVKFTRAGAVVLGRAVVVSGVVAIASGSWWLKGQVDEATEILKSTRQSVAELAADLKDLHQAFSVMSEANAGALQSAIGPLEEKIEKLQSDHTTDVGELKTRTSVIEHDVKQMQDGLGGVQSQLQAVLMRAKGNSENHLDVLPGGRREFSAVPQSEKPN